MKAQVESTVIPNEIQDFFIGETGLVLGKGYNYLTTQPEGTAVSRFSLATNVSTQSPAQIQVISSAKELDQVVDAQLGTSFEFGDLKLETKLEFISKIVFSARSFSVVYWRTYTDKSYPEPDGGTVLKLTEEADEALGEGVSNFREQYGDYFVSSIRKRSACLIVCNFSSSSSDKIVQFRSKVSGEYQGFLTGNISEDMKSEMRDNNIAYRINAFADGYSGSLKFPTEYSEIKNFINAFDEQREGTPYWAQLTHYSLLEGVGPKRFPPQVPVSQDLLLSLQSLKKKLLALEVAYNADFPVYYKQSFGAAGIDKVIQAAQETIEQFPDGQTTESLAENIRNIDAWTDKVDSVLNRKKLYDIIRDRKIVWSPGYKDPDNTMTEGVLSITDSSVLKHFSSTPGISNIDDIIPTVYNPCIEVYRGHSKGHVQTMSTIPAPGGGDAGLIIIGWNINNGETHGWVEVKEGGILEDKVVFEFGSSNRKWINSQISYRAVPKELFMFDLENDQDEGRVKCDFQGELRTNFSAQISSFELQVGENVKKMKLPKVGGTSLEADGRCASISFWYKLDRESKVVDMRSSTLDCEESPFLEIGSHDSPKDKILLSSLHGDPGAHGVSKELAEDVLAFYEDIIEAVCDAGFTVVVKSPIDLSGMSEEEIMKLSPVYRENKFVEFYNPEVEYDELHEIRSIESIFHGITYLSKYELFQNVSGSTVDPKIAGQTWRTLWWQNVGNSYVYEGNNMNVCTSLDYLQTANSTWFSCTVGGITYGGHVVEQGKNPVVPAGSNYVFIMPICPAHNQHSNVGMMRADRHRKGVALYNYLKS